RDKKRAVNVRKCKEGEILTIDGECLQMKFNEQSKDAELWFDPDKCTNPDTMRVYTEMALGLVSGKGRLKIKIGNNTVSDDDE
ncbi:unnamed protein product, partial [marine sediment metagenome]